jgi:hypothetical protein
MPSHTLAELNEIAQGVANKLGHIDQELLFKIHTLVHMEDVAKGCSTAPCQSQQPVSGVTETPAV